MKALCLFVLTAASSLTASGQDADAANVNCIKRLEVPTYPRLAVLARVTGTATAAVTLDAEAKTQKVETSYEPRSTGLLGTYFDGAFRKSEFRKECAGKTVRIIFHFEIAGRPAENPKVTVAFGYPNEFWVVSEPSTPLIN